MTSASRHLPRPAAAPRGVALLIVLGALLVIAGGVVVLARVRATARLQERIDERSQRIDELLAAAEAPILDWLGRDSTDAVTDPDAAAPGVLLLHDTIEIGGQRIEIRIGAFDQHAMLPWDDARSASPLRHAFPPAVRARLQDVPTGRQAAPGLDLLGPGRGEDVCVYPEVPIAEDGAPVGFGGGPPNVARSASPSGPPPPLPHSIAAPPRPAIGAWLGTHAPSPAEINVNTAPRDLLAEAMDRADRSGLEEILETRRAGKAMRFDAPAGGASQRTRPAMPRRLLGDPGGAAARATPPGAQAIAPAANAPGQASDRQRSISVVSSSRTWSVRTDVTVDGTTRSRWSVWQLTPRGWTCLQRLEVRG